eukprot:2310302-Rhodomonas_salina.1
MEKTGMENPSERPRTVLAGTWVPGGTGNLKWVLPRATVRKKFQIWQIHFQRVLRVPGYSGYPGTRGHSSQPQDAIGDILRCGRNWNNFACQTNVKFWERAFHFLVRALFFEWSYLGTRIPGYKYRTHPGTRVHVPGYPRRHCRPRLEGDRTAKPLRSRVSTEFCGGVPR